MVGRRIWQHLSNPKPAKKVETRITIEIRAIVFMFNPPRRLEAAVAAARVLFLGGGQSVSQVWAIASAPSNNDAKPLHLNSVKDPEFLEDYLCQAQIVAPSSVGKKPDNGLSSSRMR